MIGSLLVSGYQPALGIVSMTLLMARVPLSSTGVQISLNLTKQSHFIYITRLSFFRIIMLILLILEIHFGLVEFWQNRTPRGLMMYGEE